jgi:capsular polysaccharide biosynthesis protein
MTSSAEASERGLTETVRIIGSRAGLIVLTTIGGLLLAALASMAMPPIYKVEFSVIARPPEAQAARSDLARVAGTWVYVLSDAVIREQAAARLSQRYDSESLRSVHVSVRPVDNSMVIATTVRAGSAELAADFARALFEVASASEVARPFPIMRLGSLQPPAAPESPRGRRNLLLGAGAGFLLGIALAFLLADLERGRWTLPPFLANH